MKAIVAQQAGGPEVIELVQTEKPKLSPSQVLIQVEWAGINYFDVYVRSGLYPTKLPKSLGTECAGVVTEIGSAAKNTNLKIGDKVAAYAIDTSSGALAEYAAVESDKVIRLDGISTKDAVIILIQGLTALTFMAEAAPVQKDDYVLVHAAAGGLGSRLIQVGKAKGAHVIGVVSSQEKANFAESLGAEHVVVSKDEPAKLVETVLKITNGKGVKAIFDGVGRATWESDFQMISRKGTIVFYGNASGPVPPFSVMKLVFKNIKVCRPGVNYYLEELSEWEDYTSQLFKLFQNGQLDGQQVNEYAFTTEGIRRAHEELTSRKTMGKLLTRVAEL